MKKKQQYLWPTILAATLAVGVFIGGKLHFNDSPEKLFTTNSKKDKLNRLIDYIDYEYVDEINTDSIVDVAVNNILDKLDPHSVYIPKKDMAKVSENMKGDFVGIGISFFMENDTISVVRTIEDGPSYNKGIEPGDRILMADNVALFGQKLPNDVIIDKLKGKKGTPVKLKIYRKKDDKTFTVTITRDNVPLKSVEASYMLTRDMGYIKVNRFAESTYKEFKTALTNLQKQGALKLTLDLRDNPGGYLGIAEQMADEFLKDHQLILFTKNKKGQIDSTYATKKGSFENKPIYVLINERSASASEIIAGALQDNDIGTIVGRRSFGKGLVQREMELGDGSAVRLTIARYYTPTGRSIQKDYAKGNKDYYQKFTDRYTTGELVSVDSIKVADSLKFKTPKGKVVYGGGGIIPDIFVPIQGYGEEAISFLESGGIMSRFIFNHLEEDRNRYNDYSEKDFVGKFKVDDILFEKFINYMQLFSNQEESSMNYYEYEDKIKLYLKASIAEQIYNPNAYAIIKGQDDPMLIKVQELERPIIRQKDEKKEDNN
ncbi:S41 family peptidase [Cellulophaga tyrosinoxydans]|uniref:Carboxyl-terminal processing protease n=1 Tax=Cellulophaga tyrosinoxydans TaxID=504486 RepID=A0A1W1YLM4_9FLAO|nr:S41 family peptidase [Cellulophaga tyrosinoxydans]SMC37077.1 carboxyl-terminal processing protease [Cellulophaga tyrosinoxydans]